MDRTSNEFGKSCVVIPVALPVALVVLIKPTAKGRPRFGKGSVFTPEKTRKYEEVIRKSAGKAMAGRPPFDGPVGVKCEFCFKTPRKSAENVGEWKPGRPDLDNLLKAVTDAMNGIVYNDDSQIVIALATKKQALCDSVFIEVKPLEGGKNGQKNNELERENKKSRLQKNFREIQRRERERLL